MIDFESITSQVERLLHQVAAMIREESNGFTKKDIEHKSTNSLVTYVDKLSEKQLVEGLRKILPEAGFLTEENTVEPSNQEYTWIIDPIDGTTNFIHRIPFYSISVALQHHEDLVIGAVYEINHQESFKAWQGGGAFLNNRPISVSSAVQLKDAVIATGFPYYDYNALNPYLNTFEYFLKNTRGLRRFGSAALDLAYVACGRFDGFFEYSLYPWDVAGGIVLVREAGGVVLDFKGNEEPITEREIIAANPEISMRMTNVIKSAFGY